MSALRPPRTLGKQGTDENLRREAWSAVAMTYDDCANPEGTI